MRAQSRILCVALEGNKCRCIMINGNTHFQYSLGQLDKTCLNWPCFEQGRGWDYMDNKNPFQVALFYGSTWFYYLLCYQKCLLLSTKCQND